MARINFKKTKRDLVKRLRHIFEYGVQSTLWQNDCEICARFCSVDKQVLDNQLHERGFEEATIVSLITALRSKVKENLEPTEKQQLFNLFCAGQDQGYWLTFTDCSRNVGKTRGWLARILRDSSNEEVLQAAATLLESYDGKKVEGVSNTPSQPSVLPRARDGTLVTFQDQSISVGGVEFSATDADRALALLIASNRSLQHLNQLMAKGVKIDDDAKRQLWQKMSREIDLFYANIQGLNELGDPIAAVTVIQEIEEQTAALRQQFE